MRRAIVPLAAVGILIMGALPCAGSTYIVRPDGTGDFPTIQAAIDHAVAGDVIELTDGVFLGAGNRDLDYAGKAILVHSASGDPELCILDCQGSEGEPHRAVSFDGGEGPTSILRGVTIRNGVAAGADPPNLESCGGAVLVTGNAQPTITDVVFRDNTAKSGGAVAIWQGGGTFTRCLFAGNVGWWGTGGGIWAHYAIAAVEDCRFESNRGHQSGGGARFSSSSQVTIRRCWFERNRVDAGGYGAGLDFSVSMTGSVEECTFWNNSFAGGAGTGGGFYAMAATATVARCTFVANEAAAGGAIGAYFSADVTVTNAILAFNAGGAVSCQGATPALACCDVFGNMGGDWVGCIAAQHGVNGNIAADPLFCDAPTGDFALHVDSPCAPAHSPPGCELIGAWPAGCGVVPVAPATWGEVKARFR